MPNDRTSGTTNRTSNGTHKPLLLPAVTATAGQPPVHRPGHRPDYTQLAVGMIEQAMRDLDAPKLRDDAAAWIAGRRCRLPFVVVCELIDLDPDAVRDRLRTRGTLHEQNAA